MSEEIDHNRRRLLSAAAMTFAAAERAVTFATWHRSFQDSRSSPEAWFPPLPPGREILNCTRARHRSARWQGAEVTMQSRGGEACCRGVAADHPAGSRRTTFGGWSDRR